MEYVKSFAEEEGDKRFLFSENTSFTAREAYHIVCGVANRLADLGVGDRSLVALKTTRSIPTVFLFFALQSIGAIVLLCDPHTEPLDFLESTGVEVQPNFILTEEDGAWSLNGTPFDVSTPGENRSFVTDIYAPSAVIFTSGSTTGKGKGVILSQFTLLNHYVNVACVSDFQKEDIAPEALPIHHAFGLVVVLMGLEHRYELFFPKDVSVEYMGKCIQDFHLTRFDMVPSFLLALAKAKGELGFDTSSLRSGVIAGAPSTREQFFFIQQTLGMQLLPIYGMSESIGLAGLGPEYSDEKRATTVGKFFPMNTGYIVDRAGNELPQGQEGEICLKGPELMLGYWNDEERTHEAIDEQGRLHTGDLGFIDEDGCLHITGRIKDVVIRNGNNLSAKRIEDKIRLSPCVLDTAVVGISDEKCGEVPVALVILRDGMAFDEESVRKQLTRLELPKEFRIVESFPLTPSGKINKPKIKEMFSCKKV